MDKEKIKVVAYPIMLIFGCLLYLTFNFMNSYISAFILLIGILASMLVYSWLADKYDKKENTKK